ncbi:hypothetical protein [Pseudomonas sp. OTU750018]|uniref:hypothetical protein n=1 Tax=Pseudomonas sp. OTU750018 TaxID=2709708 RepID=UPI00141F1003|nr:hypothetical protein [Pseudomonas sp. OTU750018]
MQAHQISNSGSKESGHYQAIAQDEHRARSMSEMRSLVLTDIGYADPQTCSAFADFCAERLTSELTMALCLAKIHGDGGLLSQALSDLGEHVKGCRKAFCEQEVDRRIAAAQVANEAMLERAHV